MAKGAEKMKAAFGAGKRKAGPLILQQRLIQAAKNAQKAAYCPYSRYPVGAAVLTESGRIYSGCNVENASFGLACCAERVAIFNAVSKGDKKIKSVCVVARSAKPCGACRQVIFEFSDRDGDFIGVHLDPMEKREKITRMKISQLLPNPFEPAEAGL